MSGKKIRPGLIVKKVEEAFSKAVYPGDKNIVYDNSDYDLECKEIATEFKGKSWQELQLPTLRYHHASLFFFSPEGYCYYLPAYLRVSVAAYRDADMIPSSVLFSLTLPKGELDKKRFHSRMSKFTLDQKMIIREFLEFMESEHGEDFPVNSPQAAINRFWRQFG